MGNPSEDPRVLKAPKIGPQQEISPEAAYLAAVTSLPRLISDVGQVLAGILDELNGIHDKLDVMALYHERKGISENLISTEEIGDSTELEGGEEDGSEAI